LSSHRDLYLTTYKTHKREILVPLAGFETAIPASQRPQPHALDRVAREMFLYVLTGLSEISVILFPSKYFPENCVEQSSVV
jgi:hypothetical protein